MRNVDTSDYIPSECVKSALFFVQKTSEDVKNYEFLRKVKSVKQSDKADFFCAWWNLQRYEFYPHALITLYEAENEIDEEFGEHNVQNIIEFLQHRLIGFYDLLKKEGMLEDGTTEEN